MQPRVRAPELTGRGWLNTGGRALSLSDLRGKVVILDFWTFCCINCLHVLDELRPLEEKYGDALVIIGVHSPKFEHERDPAALAAAVERYGVHHPVLDDVDMRMWQQYAAKAWPTLSVIDPEGYVVASMAGEGHAEGLMRLLDELIAVHGAKGTLRRGDGPYVPPAAADTLLRFPGKAIELPNGNLLVSDSARHSLVELTADGESLVRRFGTGERGRADGSAEVASFSEPQGLCLLPEGTADYDVVVADTVNHLLRGLRLSTGEVVTVAGTGRPWRSAVDDGESLSSPWDVAWFSGQVIIAMAGIHQLWWFDPATGGTGVYAGTTVESLRDGKLPDVWMAQPSGLSAAGDRLWIADSETSALRWIEAGELHTAVGQGLFDFGHVDGPAREALLQHPLGVCALPDGSVLIADTYNGAIRRFDPAPGAAGNPQGDAAEPAGDAADPAGNATDVAGNAAGDAGGAVGGPAGGVVSTVDSGLAEPSDILLTRAGAVFVVESGAHRLVRLAPGAVRTVAGERHRTERPPSPLAPGEVRLDVVFTPAPGQKLDSSFGPSTRLVVSASPPELLLEGAGTTTDLSRRLVLNPAVPGGILQVVAQAATCDADVEHAACHLTRQDWGVPILVARGAPSRLPLILRGLDG